MPACNSPTPPALPSASSLAPLSIAMKLATWNVNSLGVRLPQLLAWLEANPVDVIALQETKRPDDKFPLA